MKLLIGLNPMKFFLSIAFAFLVLCTVAGIACKAADPVAVELLPKAGDIEGWNIYPKTLVYAAGENLTKIYDGGYKRYTDNGVLDAAQQMYCSNADLAIVVVHRMKTPEAAKNFFGQWKTADEKEKTDSFKTVPLPDEAYLYTATGAVNGCLYRDKFFATVLVYLGDEKGPPVCEAFLDKISAAVGKLLESEEQKQQNSK